MDLAGGMVTLLTLSVNVKVCVVVPLVAVDSDCLVLHHWRAAFLNASTAASTTGRVDDEQCEQQCRNDEIPTAAPRLDSETGHARPNRMSRSATVIVLQLPESRRWRRGYDDTRSGRRDSERRAAVSRYCCRAKTARTLGRPVSAGRTGESDRASVTVRSSNSKHGVGVAPGELTFTRAGDKAMLKSRRFTCSWTPFVDDDSWHRRCKLLEFPACRQGGKSL